MYVATIALNASLVSQLVLPKEKQDIIQRMFGGLRGFVGDWAFMKAEEYHHRGLPFMEAHAYHQGESLSAEMSQRSESNIHETEHGKRGIPNDIFSKVYAAVKVTEDSHLKPSEEKEVLPWFYVETAFNPGDLRGYVLGGYWLERMGRIDEALKFLKEGQRNNPKAADILASIGWIYYKKNNIDMAMDYLSRAHELWLEGKYPNEITNQYAKSDMFFAVDLLAGLYERKGNYRKAMKLYQELYAIEPNNAILEKMNRVKGVGSRV